MKLQRWGMLGVLPLVLPLVLSGRLDAAGATVYTSVNAPQAPKVADMTMKDSVTKDGITGPFEKARPGGQCVNGG